MSNFFLQKSLHPTVEYVMRVRLHYVYNVLVGVCETISAKYLRDKIAEDGWERIAVGCQERGRGGGILYSEHNGIQHFLQCFKETVS